MNSWKTIPGVNENGEINTEELNSWIHKVRELAIETDRLEVVDIQIGKLLAQYPENNKIWPPKEICQVIESINTDSLISNFSSAMIIMKANHINITNIPGFIINNLSLYYSKKSPF